MLLDRFWDDEHGMVVEEWDESFSTLDAYRGVNANMHTVEAFLAAADAPGTAACCDRALRIMTRVVHDLGAGPRVAAAGALRRAVEPAAGLQPRHARPTRSGPTARRSGTGWSGPGWRCTCGPRSARRRPGWMLDDAVALFEASVREGWAVDGADGFVYTVDWTGTPVVRERMHWVAAEATATAAALHAATGDPSYAAWYATWWDHLAEVFLDHELGSWRHELDPREPAERRGLERQAGHLPRLPGHPDPAPAADPDARRGAARRAARLDPGHYSRHVEPDSEDDLALDRRALRRSLPDRSRRVARARSRPRGRPGADPWPTGADHRVDRSTPRGRRAPATRTRSGFVPPPPPPLPRVAPDRLLAWSASSARPLVLLTAVVLGVHLPGWLGYLLVGGFVGGFVYLVTRMPRGPRDPADDGARL